MSENGKIPESTVDFKMLTADGQEYICIDDLMAGMRELRAEAAKGDDPTLTAGINVTIATLEGLFALREDEE